MKLLSLLLCVTAALAELQAIIQPPQPLGIDVGVDEGNVDWNAWKAKGYMFAIIKATGGTSYTNPDFHSQHAGATKAGFIRGAYHFGNPAGDSGKAQASYFLKHGGGWTADGITLPGSIILEDWCYGLTQSEMVSWIKGFSSKYHHSTGRYPVLSTGLDKFWEVCTGNTHAFASSNPLWLDHLGTTIGPLPGGWSHATIWQFDTINNTLIDKFVGDSAALKRFALGH